MKRPAWTAPIAAIIACCGVATIIDPVDLWLGGLLLVAAIVILILPATAPAAGQVASTGLPPSPVSHPAGVVEADVRQPREVA